MPRAHGARVFDHDLHVHIWAELLRQVRYHCRSPEQHRGRAAQPKTPRSHPSCGELLAGRARNQKEHGSRWGCPKDLAEGCAI
eukprot:6357571-Alexandrium_andersonii.AAC.1